MKNYRSFETSVRAAGWLVGSFLLVALLLSVLLGAMQVEAEGAGETAVSDFGYGFNMAAWDLDRLQNMGFNWMKVFNGPGSRLPVNVLLRVEANASHMSNVTGFGDSIAALAQSQKGFVEAYEIGNEPNLDASYGWGAAPVAADYVTLLCEAYGRIKAIDPNVRVVSAGLAPTGRVTGDWEGHSGHNGLYQDEREFLKELITAGGGNCLDGVGYHPYGFSADFDAEPDVNLGESTTNCTNGFCFRGVEKIYEIMQANGLGDKTVWATEFGWIVEPPSECLADPSWYGRLWQIVTEQKQADNLVGAFQYATTNWPWMETMIIFNLNFNQAGYPTCEQMRYYAVQGRPAEAALSAMPKVTSQPIGELLVSSSIIGTMITPEQQPFVQEVGVPIENVGTAVFTYTVAANPDTLTPGLINSSGAVQPGETAVFTVTLNSSGQPVGTYGADLVVTAVPTTTLGVSVTIPVKLFIVDQIYSTYLPLVLKQ
ncbi:MAG: hypothetical protein H6667_15845 [Ardenticatenaceae bacterium]|nr:hypothetical protein [Ardenticatenaceae bacterium]MCB9443708.1 hypothetical protein [Ardenticatenaceae bacterium]